MGGMSYTNRGHRDYYWHNMPKELPRKTQDDYYKEIVARYKAEKERQERNLRELYLRSIAIFNIMFFVFYILFRHVLL